MTLSLRSLWEAPAGPTAPAPRPEPEEIPDLSYRWIASDLALADGSSVSTWPNAVTGGGALSQSTATNRPTFVANAVNGKPAVRFDGVDDVLIANPPATAQPLTIIVIHKANAMASGAHQLIDTTSIEIYWNNTSYTFTAGGSSLTAGTPNTTDWRIVGIVASGTSSDAYIDGTQVITDTSMGTTGLDTVFYSGRRRSSLTRWLSADVAEYLIFTRALTALEMAYIDSYAQDTYGITVSDYIPPPPAPMSEFVETFDGTTLDLSTWTMIYGNSSMVSVSDGKLHLSSSGTTYAGVLANNAPFYNLEGSEIVWGIDAILGSSNGYDCTLRVVEGEDGTGRSYGWMITNDSANQGWYQAEETTTTGGVKSILKGATMPTAKRLRIREAGGTIYWDYSTEFYGDNWVNWHSKLASFMPWEVRPFFGWGKWDAAVPDATFYRLYGINETVTPPWSPPATRTLTEWFETFEAGAVLDAAASGTAFDEAVGNGSATIIAGLSAINNDKSVQFAGTANRSLRNLISGGTVTRRQIRFYFRPDNVTTNQTIWTAFNGTTSVANLIYRSTDAMLLLRGWNGTALALVGTTTLPVAQAVTARLEIDVNAGTGITLRTFIASNKDGTTPSETISGAHAASGVFDRWTIGKVSSTANTLTIDSVAADTTVSPGPVDQGELDYVYVPPTTIDYSPEMLLMFDF